MAYHQLTEEQRYKIEALRKSGLKQKEIAEQIGVHPSTISRELSRNFGKSDYWGRKAQRTTQNRRKDRGCYKLTGDIEQRVRADLEQKWSPEQIVGRAKETGQEMVSHETIYQYIYRDKKHGGSLHENLRRQRKKRRKRLPSKDKRGQIPGRVDIDERPKEVDEKVKIGHWEADTVVLKNHRGAIVTLVERVTKFLVTMLLPNREAENVQQAIIKILKENPLPVKTITYDNGKEFTGHLIINKALKCASFFCKPYHSWERGLNENTNGLIRQYIPKGTALEDTSKEYLEYATKQINTRPRKCLNYQSALECAQSQLNNQIALQR